MYKHVNNLSGSWLRASLTIVNFNLIFIHVHRLYIHTFIHTYLNNCKHFFMSDYN